MAYSLKNAGASLVAQRVKHLPAMRETRVQSLSWEDPLEKEMSTHYSYLENPMDGEACRLQSMVGYSLWGCKESDMTEQLHFHFLWGGRREEGSGWGTRVYSWRIHVDVWQNQYNIVKKLTSN